MSLTSTDLNKIREITKDELKTYDQSLGVRLAAMFKANNDILFNRLMEVLKHFPTRTEMHEELQKLSDQMVKRDEFLELKDDVATIKLELREFRAFTEHNQQRHEQDIHLIKSHLRLR